MEGVASWMGSRRGVGEPRKRTSQPRKACHGSMVSVFSIFEGPQETLK